MRAGKLNRRVVIESCATTQDAYGQRLTTWSTLANAWAYIKPLAGYELVAAQAVHAETTHQVDIRYQAGITTAHRVNFSGRLFNIVAVLDIDMGHRALRLLCSEGLNQG